MPTFEVFSYWNVHELHLVFNAVASVVGSSDYLGLMRTLALVGMISLAMAVLAGMSQLPDFGRWIIMLAVFNAILLVPKVTVVITDQTGTQPPVTVANVPLGLAAFAHSISHTGNWLTTTFETVFSLPADMQFRTNGTLWGHRVQQEMLHQKFQNPILSSNLLEFYRECVLPEFATGNVSAADMSKSNDIWTYLNGKTNPGRLVTIRAMPGSPVVGNTYNCDNAYYQLTGQISADVLKQMDSLGHSLYPGLPTAAASAQVQGVIQTSTNYILGISTAATQAVRQTAMSNFMIDAQYLLPAQIGDAAGAASNLAQAQAIRSTSESYKMMAKMAESTMPKIKSFVEIVAYAVFPIILLIVLMLGHKGGAAFKGWILILMWVQLWPPLYAIMHMIMTVHAQELAQTTAHLGLSMSEYSRVNNAYISDEAIAGMLSATAIPGIAWAIVSGGAAAAVSAMSPATSSARESEKFASAAASGNLQMGNASLNSQSADNLSMGQVNTRPTITQGGYSHAGSDGTKYFHGTNANGSSTTIADTSGSISNLGTNFKLSGSRTAAAELKSVDAERTSRQENKQAANSITAANNQFSSFERGRSKELNAQTIDQTSSATQALQSYATEKNFVEEASEGFDLNQTQKAEVEAHARIGGTPFVEVGAGMSAAQISAAKQMNGMLTKLTDNKKYAEAVNKTNTAMHSNSFAQGDSGADRAAKGLRESLDESASHVRSSQASHEKSLAYSKEAKSTQQAGASYDRNATQKFMDFATDRIDADTNEKYTPEKIAQMSVSYDTNLETRFDNLRRDFIESDLRAAVEREGIPTPVNDVASVNSENMASIPDADSVRKQAATNRNKVKTQQNQYGVNPDDKPVNTVAPQVAAAQNQAGGQINEGLRNINKEGDPIVTKAKEFTDPNKTSNVLNVVANTADSVLPNVTSLANDAGILPDASSAATNADNRGGTVGEHALGAVVEVGSMFVGGVAGRGIGKAAEIELGLGEAAGNAAEQTALRTAEVAGQRLTALEAKAAAQNTFGQAAVKTEQELAAAAAAKQTTTFNTASNAGAKAQVLVEKTVPKLGAIAGTAAGVGVAHSVTSEDGLLRQHITEPIAGAIPAALDKAKQINSDAEDITKDGVNQARQVVEGVIKR